MKRISIQKVLWLIIICDTVEKQNVFVMWESKEVNLKNCPKFHDLTYVLFHDLKKKKIQILKCSFLPLVYMRQSNLIYSCDWLWQSCFIYKPLCNSCYLIKCHFMLFWDNWSNWQRKRRQNSIIVCDEYILYCKHRDSNK